MASAASSGSDFVDEDTMEHPGLPLKNVFFEVNHYVFENKNADALMALWPQMCVVFDAHLSSRALQRIRMRLEEHFDLLESLRLQEKPDVDDVNKANGGILFYSEKADQLLNSETISTAYLLHQVDNFYRQVDTESQISDATHEEVQDIIITREDGELSDHEKEEAFIQGVNQTITALFFQKLLCTKSSALFTQYHLGIEKLREANSPELKKEAMKILISAISKMFLLYFYSKTSAKELHIINGIYVPVANLYNNSHLLEFAENGRETRAIIEDLFNMFMDGKFDDLEILEPLRDRMVAAI